MSMRDELEPIFQRHFDIIMALNEIALGRDRADALQLTKLRVELSKSIMAMQRDVPEKILAKSRAPKTHELLETYKDVFAEERRRITEHQSRWTAPAMAADRQGYESAVKALFGLHSANHEWRMNVMIPQLGT